MTRRPDAVGAPGGRSAVGPERDRADRGHGATPAHPPSSGDGRRRRDGNACGRVRRAGRTRRRVGGRSLGDGMP